MYLYLDCNLTNLIISMKYKPTGTYQKITYQIQMKASFNVNKTIQKLMNDPPPVEYADSGHCDIVFITNINVGGHNLKHCKF